jgi:hypothetical protein
MIAEGDLGSKMLGDALENVPDACFVKNPTQRRGALQGKLGAVANMSRAGNVAGTAAKLDHDFRPKVDHWLIDECESPSPLGVTKTELLELIDRAIDRIAQSVARDIRFRPPSRNIGVSVEAAWVASNPPWCRWAKSGATALR